MSVTREELKYKQSKPLFEKIEMSQCIIEQWWGHWSGSVYVAFSGGKDSSVLLNLVRGIFPDIPAVYSDTGLEYPEVKQHVKSVENVTILRPKMTYRQVIDKYGYPMISKEQSRYLYDIRISHSEKLKDIRINGNRWGMGKVSKKWLFLIDAPFKISHKCCDALKKNPIITYERKSGRKPYLGMLATESSMRTETYLRFGCNAFGVKRPTSNPLSFWNEQDILEFIVQHNVKIPSVYGDIIRQDDGTLKTSGVNRTGCMWCLFGIQRETEPNRIQKLKETHPKIYEYIINDLDIGNVLDYINVPYE